MLISGATNMYLSLLIFNKKLVNSRFSETLLAKYLFPSLVK